MTPEELFFLITQKRAESPGDQAADMADTSAREITLVEQGRKSAWAMSPGWHGPSCRTSTGSTSI